MTFTATATFTTTTTCGAPRKITGCARDIGHNGGHTTIAEINHFGNAHAADAAINGATRGNRWTATIAAIICGTT